MKKYNYLEAIKQDIQMWLEDNADSIDYNEIIYYEDLESYLYDTLWCEDSVTGNASGSYTFNTWEAEENLCHNLDLLGEALAEFCCDVNTLEKGAEWCDVTIRCYLLYQAISEVLEENGGEDAFLKLKEESEEK